MNSVNKQKINLAILISGRGSNMEALIKACEAADFPAQVSLVVSNRQKAEGLQKAESRNIPTCRVNAKQLETTENFENAILKALDTHNIDCVCLAGFMKLLSSRFIEEWGKPILNIHPSLLPEFGGPGMYGIYVHQAVIQEKVKETGVTVHHVTAEIDEGPVIIQRRISVLEDDTPETLSERVLKQEHIAYPEAVKIVANELLQK